MLVEDQMQRVVAYSEQYGPLDDIRRDSILNRRSDPQVQAWVRTHGALGAREPLRVPGAPHLGFLPRLCVPARRGDRLLGFLWFIDADGSMTGEAIAVAAEAAAKIAVALFHESLVAELSARREREAVAHLLSGDTGEHEASADLLIDANCFPRSTPVTVHVVSGPGGVAGEALEHGLLLLRRRLGGRAPLHLVRADHGVLLATDARLGAPDVLPAFEVPVTVGAGRPRPRLAEAAQSYAEAMEATSIATRIPGFGPIAEWSELGVYRWLARLSATPPEAHPGLGRLLSADPELARTLEAYLDLAGSAREVAARLGLHRSTLYHRLNRIEVLTGAKLSDGQDRLALHLGLKLARLSGMLAGP